MNYNKSYSRKSYNILEIKFHFPISNCNKNMETFEYISISGNRQISITVYKNQHPLSIILETAFFAVYV